MTLGRHSSLTMVGAAVALVAVGALAPSAQDTSRFRLQGLPEASGPPVQVSKELLQRERDAAARGDSRTVSVIVRLAGDPLASYTGTIAGLQATSPRLTGGGRLNTRSAASRQYLAYLEGRQSTFKNRLAGAIPSALVPHQYQAAVNGLSVVVPESQISELAALPEVAAIYQDKLEHLDTDTSPGFIGATDLWNTLGGQESAGEGVIVGVLDTGIWPEHPSLSDPDPSGKPYSAPGGPARACQFSGGGNPGPAFTCNNKLIGAQRSMATYEAVAGLTPAEYTTARDDDGHGTHTSTTAAGNGGVSASIFARPFGTISGIAPRAHIMAYKVCGLQGCFQSDLVAAINDAILDEVDVLNFSISGGADPYTDAVSLAFLDAYNAGIFVAASAGNSGPAANTTDHREPWVTTVAASSTNRQFQSTLRLAASGASLQLNGASVTRALSVPTPVVVPADTLCLNPFAPGSVTGKVVVCRRGTNARVAKSFNVAQGGAVGMILYNAALEGLATDNHFVPSVHLENNDGAALTAFVAAHPNTTATITAGTAVPAQGDVMAAFSSRGGTGLTLGIAKPDITAPGVQILAGHTPTPAIVDDGVPGQLFQAIQGTSMSSPHITGSAALIKALHADWTPGQIRSALMTTATGDVVKEDGIVAATPFDDGSGRVDLSVAGDAGLLFDESAVNYVALRSHLWDANHPSLFVPGFPGEITVHRTVQNARRRGGMWRLRVTAPSDLQVRVPNTLNVPAQGKADLAISVDGRGIPLGQARHALLELSRPNEATLRFPITVVRGTPNVPLTKTCTPLEVARHDDVQCTITITNTTFDPAIIGMIDRLPVNDLKLDDSSIVNATPFGNNGLLYIGPVAPAEPPGITVAPGESPAGYLPLSLFGVAPVSGVADDTITNFTTPPFLYGTEVYTRVGFASNGYIVVGGGSGPDVSIDTQQFTNPARPNNVLAPFWTDLNPGAAGAMRIATLTDGADTWLVLDWAAVREFSLNRRASFEVWIGLNSDAHPEEDVSFAYGTIQGNGDGGLLSVGAENRFGNRRQNTYFNGAGTLPANGTQLRVAATPAAPGETRVITFTAKAKNKGPWTNCAEMASNVYFGTQTACVSGTTVK